MEALSEGFKEVRRNHGPSGVDGVTIEEFESRFDGGLDNLKEEL